MSDHGLDDRLAGLAGHGARTGVLGSAADIRRRGDRRRRNQYATSAALGVALCAALGTAVVLNQGGAQPTPKLPANSAAPAPSSAPTTPSAAPSTPVPSGSASRSASGTPTDPTSKPPTSPTKGTGRWAGSTQFMEVRSAEVRDGALHLEVRPATRVSLGESFETEPIPGPYTDVACADPCRIRHLDGRSDSRAEFLDGLQNRTQSQRVEAFDITFDGTGAVKLIEWLYVP